MYPLFLLLLLGFVWGSGYTIAKSAMTLGVPPLAYAFWQSAGPAMVLLGISLLRGKSMSFSKAALKYYFVCGLLGIAIPNTNMYFAAQHLPAGILAVIVNTVPIFTYLLALSLGQEKFNVPRFIAVLLGIIGIMMLVLFKQVLSLSNINTWAIMALLSPLAFALCAIYGEKYRPQDNDSLMLAVGMMIFSSCLLSPLVLYSHEFYVFHWPLLRADQLILLEIVLSSLGYILFFELLRVAGSVYYSMVGGTVALTGLFWGYVFLQEHLQAYSIVAIVLIISAILLLNIFKRQS